MEWYSIWKYYSYLGPNIPLFQLRSEAELSSIVFLPPYSGLRIIIFMTSLAIPSG